MLLSVKDLWLCRRETKTKNRTFPVGAGAKAAAEPMRATMVAIFIMVEEDGVLSCYVEHQRGNIWSLELKQIFTRE